MKQILYSGLICAAMAAGCKKDGEDNPASPATKYLQSHVTTTDGQSVTYTLAYDNKNRLTEYNSEEDDYYVKITYNNQDNPIKIESESEGSTQVFEITYNGSGIPVSATSVSSSPDHSGETFESAFTYEVANGKVTKLNYEDEDGNEAVYSLTYSGDNLAKVIYTSEAGESAITWKHGSKKSPFAAAWFNYLVIPDIFAVFSSRNEVTEITIDMGEIGSLTTQYAYQYDAEGYPTEGTETDEDGNVSKTVFRYR